MTHILSETAFLLSRKNEEDVMKVVKRLPDNQSCLAFFMRSRGKDSIIRCLMSHSIAGLDVSSQHSHVSQSTNTSKIKSIIKGIFCQNIQPPVFISHGE